MSGLVTVITKQVLIKHLLLYHLVKNRKRNSTFWKVNTVVVYKEQGLTDNYTRSYVRVCIVRSHRGFVDHGFKPQAIFNEKEI